MLPLVWYMKEDWQLIRRAGIRGLQILMRAARISERKEEETGGKEGKDQNIKIETRFLCISYYYLAERVV